MFYVFVIEASTLPLLRNKIRMEPFEPVLPPRPLFGAQRPSHPPTQPPPTTAQDKSQLVYSRLHRLVTHGFASLLFALYCRSRIPNIADN